MTNYQQTVSKRRHTREGTDYHTGALPLIPAIGSAGSALKGAVAGSGAATALRGVIGSATGRSSSGGSSDRDSTNGDSDSGGDSSSTTGTGGSAYSQTGSGAAATGSGLTFDRATDIAGAGITGFTLGGLTGGSIPGPFGEMDIGNIFLGAGMVVGSGWLGLQGGYTLDTPLTPLSVVGMLTGSFLLYSSYTKATPDGGN